MLPPFRVKNIISPDSTPQSSSSATSSSAPPAARRSSSYTHGIIRMSKEAYDDLLKRLPEAVLSYIDEEDDEVVLVGSAFELGQRLQDPLPKRPPPKDIHNLGLSNIQPPLHLFDVQRHEYVLKEWRKLEEETRVAREQHVQKKEMIEEKIAFGETSPLSKNAPRRSGILKGKQHEEHAKRWASYSKDMSFDAKVHGQSSELEGGSSEMLRTSKKLPSTTTEQQLTATSGMYGVRLEEPSKLETQELSPEELRLQNYDNTAKEDQSGSSISTPSLRQRYTPLLELFQEQLSKLGTNTVEQVEDATSTSQTSAPTLTKAKVLEPVTGHEEGSWRPTTAKPTSTQRLLQEAIQTPVTAIPVAPRMSTLEEGLADSLRSIMAGVGQISAALQQTRAELHATLNLARQDFPHGNQDAVKAGVAVDTLRGGPAQPTTQSALTTTADEATPAPEHNENELPIQATAESLTPERIVNRRRILYDNDPKETQTEDHEVTEYLVHYSGRDSSDDAWCKKGQISVPRLVSDYEHDCLLKTHAATFFARDGRKRLVAENPNIRIREVERRLNAEWKGLSDAQKAPFERMALDEMERHEAEKKQLEAEMSDETPPMKTFIADPVMAEPSNDYHYRGWPSSPSSLQLSPLEPKPYQQRTLWESAALLPTKANDGASSHMSSYMPPKQETTLWDSWMEACKSANASGVSDKSRKRASTKKLKDGSSPSTSIHTTRPWMESEDKLLIELTSDITTSQRDDPLYWQRMAKKFIDRKDETLISRWNQVGLPPFSNVPPPIWAQSTKNLGKSEKLKVDEPLQHQVPGQNFVYDQPQSFTFPTSIPASQGGALADSQMQLALLEQQNKHRLFTRWQEQDPCTYGYLPSVVQPTQQAPYAPGSTGPSADYQMQLMLHEHQNRRQMEMERKHKYKQRMRYMQSKASGTTSKSGVHVGKSDIKRDDVQASRTTSTALDTYSWNLYEPSVPSTPQVQSARALADPANHLSSAFDNFSVHAPELKWEANKPDNMQTEHIQSVPNETTLQKSNASQSNLAAHMHAAPTLRYPSMLVDRWGETMPPTQAPGVYSNYVQRSRVPYNEPFVSSQSSTKKEQGTSHANSGYIAGFGGRSAAPRESAYPYSQNATDFPAYTRAMHEQKTTWSKPATTPPVVPSKPLVLSLNHEDMPEPKASHSRSHFRPDSTRTFPLDYYADGDHTRSAQTADISSVSPIYLRTTIAPTTNVKDFKPPTATTGISQPAKYCYKCGIHVADCRHTKVIALQQLKPSDVTGEAESSTAARSKPYQPGESWDSDGPRVSKAPTSRAPTTPPILTVPPTAATSKKDYSMKNEAERVLIPEDWPVGTTDNYRREYVESLDQRSHSDDPTSTSAENAELETLASCGVDT